MSREFPIGLTPPDWLVRNLRSVPAPVNRSAVARAALAMALPLAIGLAVDRPAYGALASMGALSGVIGDTADAYRMRILNIAVPQLFGAVGITLGSLVFGHGWLAVAAVTGVALVSGMISTIGAVASVSGLLLLLNSVVGAGLPMPGEWWLAPADVRWRAPRAAARAAGLAAAGRGAGADGGRGHLPDGGRTAGGDR